MLIFVGLGNSESKYLSTKHNVGFWVMDKFAESAGFSTEHRRIK
jgi:PTH1 family peptidyl-tRNA hydrolase